MKAPFVKKELSLYIFRWIKGVVKKVRTIDFLEKYGWIISTIIATLALIKVW